MADTNSMPQWLQPLEVQNRLETEIRQDLINLDTTLERNVIEYKSLIFTARIFQRTSIRKAITKKSWEINRFLREILPTAHNSYDSLLTDFQDKNNSMGSKLTDEAPRGEVFFLLDIINKIDESEFYLPINEFEAGQTISKYFNLSEFEKSILECLVYLSASDYFSDIIDDEVVKGFSIICQIFSFGLNISVENVKQVLSQNSSLRKFGIIEFDLGTQTYEVLKIEPNSRIFNYFYNGSVSSSQIDSWVAPTTPEAKTTIDDYFYIKSKLQAVSSLFKSHISGRLNKPPQILLWGKPGTGKTEFSRLCIQDNYTKCLEVPFEENKNLLNGNGRLKAYHRITHTAGGNLDAGLIFDEIEDIISRDKNDKQSMKAMLNRSIEDPKLPVIWITNSLRDFDTSYLRRFDLIINFGYLEKTDAIKIVQKHSKGMRLSRTWIKDLCLQYKLVPSVITDSLALVRNLGLTGKKAENFIKLKIDQLDEGKHSKDSWFGEDRNIPKKETSQNSSEIKYRPELSNTSVCLLELSRLLKNQSEAKLIFYGPPGTGKTAFANHLGSEIKRRSQYVNASELLNMYVGGTEQNIRELFRTAEDAGSIVVIDEADSILRPRTEANQSWEITQVNQFLSAVEQFKGICIICSNFENTLDPALYRRFDLKVKFGYLKTAQSFELFKDLATKLDTPIVNETNVILELKRLTKLVPAYFNVLARKSKFSHIGQDEGKLIDLLEEEQQWTSPDPKRIGFVH